MAINDLGIYENVSRLMVKLNYGIKQSVKVKFSLDRYIVKSYFVK